MEIEEDQTCQAGRAYQFLDQLPCSNIGVDQILFHEDGQVQGLLWFCQEHFGYLRSQVEMDLVQEPAGGWQDPSYLNGR